MRRPDEKRDAVPVTRDDERPLPDARRSIARRTGRQHESGFTVCSPTAKCSVWATDDERLLGSGDHGPDGSGL